MNQTSPKKIFSDHYRIDYTTEVISADKSTGMIQMRWQPNTSRYEVKDKDGKRIWIDKYLGSVLTEDNLKEMAKGMRGLPIVSIPAKIEKTLEYAESRLDAIGHELNTGEHRLPNEQPAKHSVMPADDTEQEMAFISVDICGSTALRAKDAVGFDRSFQFFLQELGTLVGHFNASILKITGDGFIVSFRLSSIYIQADHTVDLGLSIRALLKKAINPALSDAGLPILNIRVGADRGPAKMKSFHIPATGFNNQDIVSDALNRAVKIQEACQPNQFCIGRMLYEMVHVQWLERAKEILITTDLKLGLDDYPIYEVN